MKPQAYYIDKVKRMKRVKGEDAWANRRRDLRKNMLNDDWFDFKQWGVVSASLYSESGIANCIAEREALKPSPWNLICDSFSPRNGTAIHQCYALWLYESITGRIVSSLGSIAEFGAGYGEMARILRMYNYIDYLHLYDFPELGILQEWYLELHGKLLDATYFYDNVDEWVRGVDQPDLLIAQCSLSEVPDLQFREDILDVEPKSLLIRYQVTWDGVNNKKWFTEFATGIYDNIYQEFAPEFTNHMYLIAW